MTLIKTQEIKNKKSYIDHSNKVVISLQSAKKGDHIDITKFKVAAA